jgi:hydrogenase maturation factor
VAVPVRVLETTGSSALVEDRLGTRADVAVDFIVPAPHPGEVLLVHGGVAITRVETSP